MPESRFPEFGDTTKHLVRHRIKSRHAQWCRVYDALAAVYRSLGILKREDVSHHSESVEKIPPLVFIPHDQVELKNRMDIESRDYRSCRTSRTYQTNWGSRIDPEAKSFANPLNVRVFGPQPIISSADSVYCANTMIVDYVE